MKRTSFNIFTIHFNRSERRKTAARIDRVILIARSGSLRKINGWKGIRSTTFLLASSPLRLIS